MINIFYCLYVCIFNHEKHSEAVVWRCSVEKVFLEISQNSQSLIVSEAATGGVLQEKVILEISQKSQENTCARVSFLIKLQASSLQL